MAKNPVRETSVSMSQETAMELRAVKLDMSRAAGRSVPFSDVIAALIACWRGNREGGDGR